MQCTVHQHCHLEWNSLRHTKPVETDERVMASVMWSQTSRVESEPCCGITNWLETLDINEGQVDQDTVTVFEAAEDKVQKWGIEKRASVSSDERSATDAGWKSSDMLSVASGSSSSGLDQWKRRAVVSHISFVLSGFSWSRLADIQSAIDFRHAVTLQRGWADVRWCTCTVNLSIFGIKDLVRWQAVLLGEWD